ncbi:hypothetical protein KYI07_11075 [Macrococcus psychrotolerans]|uniref:Uncharacterized protein n=1 Tax=Macrococcus psychrotolerans TaxID=3039389 RepID=A0AAT9P3G8_9STAP|nr:MULTISPECIES: hypothetical protein [Macrococcus]QYA32842.1 hypothetical protein KYI10_11080 [Macrococcus sp. 19Msa1099]QYA37654.1 hypothetical protein KYI07_11075 [Macrococcus caseolyticus]QYA76361.1 hypothetical protein KYI12_11070 [Macrococcus caseolyticus]
MFQIDIPHSSFDYRGSAWSGYGLNIVLHEDVYNDHLEVKNYSFNTDYVKYVCNDIQEQIITQYFFDVYNGVRLISGEVRFKQYPNNVDSLSMFEFLKVDKKVSNLKFPNIEERHLKEVHYKYLDLVFKSKLNMDMMSLLNRVANSDGKSLINQYKIYDSCNTFKNNLKKEFIYADKLADNLKKFKVYNNFSNNFNTSGIIGRHGNKIGISSVKIDDLQCFVADTIELVKLVFDIQINNQIVYDYLDFNK